MSYHLENAVPHVLYDVSLPIEERKQKAIVFPSAKHVANFLGMPYNQIYALRQPGKRVRHRVTGKEYALRIMKKEVANG